MTGSDQRCQQLQSQRKFCLLLTKLQYIKISPSRCMTYYSIDLLVYTHITKENYILDAWVELINNYCLIKFIFKFINICPWMLIDIANQDIIFDIKGNYCIYTQTDSIRGIPTIISDHRIDFKDLVTDIKCYSSCRVAW